MTAYNTPCHAREYQAHTNLDGNPPIRNGRFQNLNSDWLLRYFENNGYNFENIGWNRGQIKNTIDRIGKIT